MHHHSKPSLCVYSEDTTPVVEIPWNERSRILSPKCDPEQYRIKVGQYELSVEEARAWLTPEVVSIYEPGDNNGGYKPLVSPEELSVYKIDLPKGDKVPVDLIELVVESILEESKAVLSYIDDGRLLFSTHKSMDQWMDPWLDAGIDVNWSPKVTKRLSQLLRTSLWRAEHSGLKVLIIEDPDKEKILDGGFHVNAVSLRGWMDQTKPAVADKAIEAALDKLEDADYSDEAIEALTPEVIRFLEDKRSKRWFLQRMKFEKAEAFNFRAICSEGLIKGQAFRTPEETMVDLAEELGWTPVSDVPDIIVHRANVKPELTKASGPSLIMMDPQLPENFVHTNVQQFLNFPWLFPVSHVCLWAREELARTRKAIFDGEVVDDIRELAELRETEEDSIMLHHRWMTAEVIGSGHDLRHFPKLAEQFFDAMTKGILKGGDKFTIKVPCAVRWQIISESMAHMKGWNGEVEYGEIRIWKNHGLAIVSDEDWPQVIDNHGGCDQDDHFCLYFRTVEDIKSVIVVRDPSEPYDFSVFRFRDGDWHPESKFLRFDAKGQVVDGEEITHTFPETIIPEDIRCTSEMIKSGKLTVGKLPPASKPKGKWTYTQDDVIEQVGVFYSGGSAGGYANAMMLYAMLHGGKRPDSLVCSMEEAIDACTQTSDPAQLALVQKQQDQLIRACFPKDGRVKVDAEFYEARNIWASVPRNVDGRPLCKVIQDRNGRIAKVIAFIRKVTKAYRDQIKDWAQSNHEVIPAIESKGWSYSMDDLKALKTYRWECYQLSKNQDLSPEEKDSGFDRLANWLIGQVREDYEALITMFSTVRTRNGGGDISEGFLLRPGVGDKVLELIK